MPDIVTVRDHIAWSYANLARAHAALNDRATSYVTVHHMIRARMFKGLRTGTMQFGSIFDDERVRLLKPSGCSHCGKTDTTAIDHLIPKKRGGLDTADNLIVSCRTCNSSKGGTDLMLWHYGRDTFPNLLLLRRYLKIAIAYCMNCEMMDHPLSSYSDSDLPFALSALPYDFPPLSTLRL